MTLPELAAVLEPITNETLASPDLDVRKVSVVLAAIMGAIDNDLVDQEALNALWLNAQAICDHRSGRHDA